MIPRMSHDEPFVLDSFLPYQLAVVADRLSAEFAQFYKTEFGLSRSEWRVMAHLSQDSSVSVREISVRASLDKSKVSRAVARLETIGYIAKQTSDTDRRLVVLTLTPEGRSIIDQLTPIAQAYEADVDARLGAGAAAFRSALSQMLKD